jgi:hypothetical protein
MIFNKTLTLNRGFGFLKNNSKPYLEVLSKNNNKKELTPEVLQEK